jgi:methionine-rich copper-binding protein CopC
MILRRAPLVAALAVASAPALAHAFLKNSTPSVGSTVAQAPPQVVIVFTEGVEPLFSTIAVQNASGGDVTDGKPHLAGDAMHLAVPLKPLQAGSYTVVWHATSVDTHKTEGKFTFTVGQ